ncbi:MAG: DNA mismatch repair endonuclease MutL [Acidobacteriota bacterium]|nr:DNA mismatch repair endonuclease MutL [Acidobacteriota bacterium]MDH3786633.1 DNA mismatch repair endonuclease MutL [Acidobacteriota bacterium]
MGRIQVLSDGVVNRIAAGEVVDRPASVIKELVENSLDAGATTVQVRIRSGGRQSIEVEDDGCGMDGNDALLAIERHATSKLKSAGDLESIGSLGFRGEALSSIASVSVFRLETAVEAGAGTRVRVRGGKIEGVDTVSRSRGTTICAERLFFNMPARRKFLRTESTEFSHVVKGMTRHALVNPGVRFVLTHNGSERLRVEPVDNLAQRYGQIYGKEAVDRLLAFDHYEDGFRVRGLAGRPTDGLPRRDGQHLFVNGRHVQDRVLAHAIAEAYGNTMPRGRFPSMLLFVEIAPDQVDVNVHPQKHEVRFRNSSRVHDLVRDTLMMSMGATDAVPTYRDLRPENADAIREPLRRATLSYLDSRPSPATTVSSPVERTAPDPIRSVPPPRQEPLPDRVQPRSVGAVHALLQLDESYIVAREQDGLVLLDQHAAHERVLFERFLAAAEEGVVEVQPLMFPVTLELDAIRHQLFEAEREEFQRLGFRVDSFGGTTVRIEAVPAIASELDPAELLLSLLGEAEGLDRAVTDIPALRRKWITSAACQAAIKIHHRLSDPEMQRLVGDLFQCRNPTTCPHGRPILFRLTLEEIERAFDRR